MKSYIFGPVPSHRLGRSLGVDLVPYKTCSYDCIYCQLGRTTNKTVQRKEWVPLDDVLAELEKKLSTEPDYITLSGSGEPTLFSRLDELIAAVKKITDVPVAVLTNGSLLWREEVRRQLLDADLVMPSLDVGNATSFQWANRPHESITFDRMLQGLIDFRHCYRGRYWLEVLLCAKIADSEKELDDLRKCVARIEPDRLLLGTVIRPPAEKYAVAVPRERLVEIAASFSPPGDVLPDLPPPEVTKQSAASRKEILEMLARRPCTAEDVAAGLRIHKVEALKHIEALKDDGLIEAAPDQPQLVYRATGL